MQRSKLNTRPLFLLQIAPGEYVLQVAVRDLEAPRKQQYAVRSIDFEVRP